MSGVRIHHMKLRSASVLVPTDIVLLRSGERKMHVVHLDEAGNAIVGDGVWSSIVESSMAHHFMVLNEVKDPPDMRINLSNKGQLVDTWRVVADAIEQIAPRAKNVEFVR
jgi:hypothetical protein